MSRALFVLPQGEGHSTKMLAGVAKLFPRQVAMDVLYRCAAGFDRSQPLHRLDPLYQVPGNRYFLTAGGVLHCTGPNRLADYERIVFQSMDAANARMVDKTFAADRIDVLVTDNELDGRRQFYDLCERYPDSVDAIRQQTGFSHELEQAFLRVQHYVGPATPWRALAERRRPTPLAWHDVLIPYQIYDVAVSESPPSDVTRILLFPKPTKPEFLDAALARLAELFNRFPDRRFELFCFILPHWPKLGGSVRDFKNVTLFNIDSPLPEQVYWEILLRCDAVLLNGRGGLGGILRAIAHRIDILDVWDGDSFNRDFLHGMGVACQSLDGFVQGLIAGRQNHVALERSAAAYRARLSGGVQFFFERYLA